jgi:LacI family transcriptional regulator
MRKAGASGRPTIRDVAALAGVSMGTVSRVAAGNSRISEATRVRVIAAMNELAYEPNAAARAMRTNVTKTIGLLVPDIICPVFTGLMAGAEEVLDEQGYMLFAYTSDSSPKREVAFLQAARQRQMDGLIVSVYDEAASETVKYLRTVGVPLVIVDRDLPVDADRIDVEHAGAMRAVMEHLITLGHRRISIIGASRNRPGRIRLRVFREEMARAGISVDEDLVRVDCANRDGADYGAAAAHDLLTSAEPPTAMVAGGSEFFSGALRSIRALGLEIPRDLSFVGADDARLGEIAGPTITVIDRDMREAGRQAARLLLDRFAGVSLPPRRILLTSNVLLRRSVGQVGQTARRPEGAATQPAR